ncbi:hypothetical protein C8R43DRAFT_1140657 [Mycena crocata]|nr:hypothetical protein C8R43DRAFT_1140657 [Mycena crocata]
MATSNSLVHTLADLLMQNSPLTVEIVPGGIDQWPEISQPSVFPFLHTEGHLGVPQKTLYQLYLSALPLLNGTDDQGKIDASCVILLANPAHQTALNVRKRLIQSGKSLSADAELDFSKKLLTSSRPCSKESIIWAHRRWIFDRLYPSRALSGAAQLAGYSTRELPPVVIEDEITLIARCCETDPRNYHAWTHHHFVVQSIFLSLRTPQPIDSPFIPLFMKEIRRLRRWIDDHISDYSAIHHFCSILSQLASLRSLPQYNAALGELADLAIHFEHALSLVLSFPSHESLWMYLRAMIQMSPANAPKFAASAISSTGKLEEPLRDRFVSWVERSDVLQPQYY